MAKQPPKKKSSSKTKQTSPKPEKEKSVKTRSEEADECVVVGIGASAGGLDAFQRFLNQMTPNSGIAFVLIQHLDPHHKSMMTNLLSNYTSMPVREAQDNMPIEPDHVYFIPPNQFLKMQGNQLKLDKPQASDGVFMPIDYFFRSLAAERQERAICVVLSGTGSDGTLGLKEVKFQGGMTIAQDPDTTSHAGMPKSAISSGMVDHVLSIEEMPEAIIRYIHHPYVLGKKDEDERLQFDQSYFNSITSLLKTQTNYDFRHYKKGTLLRRIQRRMGLNNIRSLEEYLYFLREHKNEIHQLYKDLLIGVTNFFREPETFETMETEVVQPLVENKDSDNAIRLWIPGCASGEEAYTLNILLHEEIERQKKNIDVQIFATDIDEEAITRARNGFYPQSIASDISATRLKQFFKKENDHYRVNKTLRESIVFAVQNLLTDPPFSNIDLISCRNVLIYMESSVQTKLFQLFHFALRDNGYLVLGNSESIGRHTNLFEPVAREKRIFRKIGKFDRGAYAFPIAVSEETKRTDEPKKNTPEQHELNNVEIAKNTLLANFAPASVMIDEEYRIHYFHGPTSQYLDFPTGEPSDNLMDLARQGLQSKLRGAIRKAIDQKKISTATATCVKRNGDEVSVLITVRHVHSYEESQKLLLVSFEDKPRIVGELKGTTKKKEGEEDKEDIVQQLEYELQATREDLQSTIEELETSNEELKVSNEEITSMNEELQSTNEELETSREELQSLNVELSAVNKQLENKVDELESINNDLDNLLNSTDIATIFLDEEFRIRRYTPNTDDVIHVLPSDIGRPLKDLSLKFDDPDIHSDAEVVLDKLQPIEKEIRTDNGKWYIRRIAEMIHSELQQLITAAKIHINGLLDSKEDAIQTLQKDFEDIGSLLGEANQQARFITQQISPLNLFRQGLAPAFESLCAQMQEMHGLTVNMNLDSDVNPTSDQVKMVLYDAVKELLFNVVKHANIDEAFLSLKRKDGSICHILVRDEGQGCELEWEKQLRDKQGFGLFNVMERIDFIGGKMKIISHPGNGFQTEITVLLEAEKKETEPDTELVDTIMKVVQQEDESWKNDPDNIKILIVDDHAMVREGIVNFLKEKIQMSVVGVASDGEEALEMVKELRPDVVLMDVHMSRMDGIEATRRIKAIFPRIEVIGVSVDTDEGTVRQMKEAGVAEYFNKEDSSEVLINMIRKVMQTE